jgi:hypothetical protein
VAILICARCQLFSWRDRWKLEQVIENVAGTISGRADGDRFQVVARAASFGASLTLVTHGGRQSVLIRSQDSQASLRGASIHLRRRG